jgi:PST family polysaccharide transporter
MTLAHRAVRGAAFVLVSSYANMAMGIIYGIIITRILDPDHFGVFALAMFFFTLFDVRGKLGLDYAFIHRQPMTDELFVTHWTLQIAASALTVAFVAIGGFIIARLNYPLVIALMMVAIAGAMIVEAIGTTAHATLDKELAFARSTAVVTGALFFSYVVAIALALAGFTYWALVAQVAVNAVIGSIGFWWVYHQVMGGARWHFCFDRDLARWMLRFGLVMSLGTIATVVLLQFDNFLVGTFVGVAALGYYALAYKVAQWPTGLVTHIVARVSPSTYAKLQNDPARLAKAFEMSLWLILTVALPLALALFATAPDLLILLYSEKWLPSAILLRFLVGYSVLRPLLDDTGALFTAIGKPERITTVLVVQAIVLVVVGTPLTLAFAAIGTAVAVGVAFVAGIALTYRFIARTLPIDLARVFAPPVIAGVGSIALYLALARVVDLNALPLLVRVVVKGGFAAGVFGAVVLLIERRALIERVSYIVRLFRSSAT